ncbi:MAG: glycerol-3-phosphate dehydrogenase/oxidase [Phycisphaerae bacterium]|nr:glycerol-3-phosphate dehydrogenase/oxidase [Phycisphaerae bacterium]
MKLRSDIWKDIKHRKNCEVLILGGGVNGTGLMRDLALQGVNCILVDKDDFTAGASSKSSRMIHGGLRYLENAEFKLVRESVTERNRLLRDAPHYVKPLKTSIPISSWFAGLIKSPMVFLGLPVSVGGRGALIVKMGLMFYDIITGKHRVTPKHFFTSKTKSLLEIPGLRRNITCTATYWDAWISQAERLCVDMIQEACAENPDCTAINYVTVTKQDSGTVTLIDQISGEDTTLQPKIVVNATGAWIDFTNKALGLTSHFMGGTKGSHLVIDNLALYQALGDRMVYYEHQDGRVCITFRFLDRVVMGSTDIKIDNPDRAECDDDEVTYMISTLKGVFPDLAISKEDIVFKFCGVRPLAASGFEYTSRASRAHHIEITEPDPDRNFRIYSMIGGKLTTFRAFAEQTADKILDQLSRSRVVSTQDRHYLGAGNYPVDEAGQTQWIERVARASHADKAYVTHLFHRYGTEAETLAAHQDESWRTPLQTLPDYSVGEVTHIARTECILHLCDLVRRRSVITFLGQATPDVLEELSGIMAPLLGWDEPRRKHEIELALTEAKNGK